MKKINMLLVLVVVFSLFSIPTLPGVVALGEAPSHSITNPKARDIIPTEQVYTPQTLLQLRSTIQEFSISEYSITNKNGYDVIKVPGFSNYIAPGAPALPVKRYYILLPPNANVNSVKLSIIYDNVSQLEGEYNIIPSPPAITVILNKTVALENGKDVYSENTLFPKEPIILLNVGEMRQAKIAIVEYSPFQYNPQTKQLILHKNIRIQISWSPTNKNLVITDKLTLQYLKKIDSKIKNNGEAQEWYIATSEALLNEGNIGYAIITTNYILQNSGKLSQYIQYLQNQNFTVYIVTEDEYGYGTGQQRAINIRNWLKNNYQSLNIKYVLLIGDPDPDDPSDPNDSYGDVPMMMGWPRAAGYNESPTDYFYADLSGNWDLDSDGYYGEYPDDFGAGGVDFFPEVFVGRIPVYNNDVSTLDSILTRLMIRGPSPKKILLPMAISNYQNEDNEGWPVTDGRKLPYYVGRVAEPKGFTITAMYEGEGLAPVPSNASYYTYNINEQNFINEWNKGYGIVLWWGHGWYTGAYRKVWTSDDGDGIPEGSEMSWYEFVDSYNTVPQLIPNSTFVFQVSCLNGYPEDPNNLEYSLLKSAAIATVAASRVSWYTVGIWEPDDYPDNAEVGYSYTEKLIEGMSAGEALYYAKSSFSATDSSSAMNLYDFNLYGDPSMTLEGTGIPRSPQTIYVDDDLNDYPQANYTTITEALNAAFPGDTIIVYPGVYNETLDITTPKITVKATVPGEAKVVGGNDDKWYIVKIGATDVSLEGFFINGTKGTGVYIDAVANIKMKNITTYGVQIYNSNGVTLDNVSIIGSDWSPLYIRSSSNIILTNSYIKTTYGNIHVSASTYIQLKNVALEGEGINIWGWDIDHYATHTIDNVTLNGEKVVYIANMNNWQMDNQQIGQLIIANATGFRINDVNVTQRNTLIAFSKEGDLLNSNLTRQDEWENLYLRYSQYITVDNCRLSGLIWMDGDSPEYYTTHTITSTQTYNGQPIVQIKNLKDQTVNLGQEQFKQVILSNLTSTYISGESQTYIDYLDAYFLVNSTVHVLNPGSVSVRFSQKTVFAGMQNGGVSISDSTGITIENSIMWYLDFGWNSYFTETGMSYILNNTINGELWINNIDGVMVQGNIIGRVWIPWAEWVVIQNNTIQHFYDWEKDTGIYLYGDNNIISSNIIKGFDTGLKIEEGSDNLIYNNLFNNSVNVVINDAYSLNYWNTTKVSGTNIVGGPYLGGNFWASPNGTGFSETCQDIDEDGICDTPYQINENNIDYLPLALNTAHIVPNVTIILPTGNIPKGTTRVMPVYLNTSTSVGAIQLALFYDPTYFNLTSIQLGESLQGRDDVIFAVNKSSGMAEVAIAIANGIQSNGELLKLSFKALGDVGDSSDLNADVIDVSDPHGKPLTVRILQGKLTIISLKGDINGDGRITATDALLYLRYVVGLDISPYYIDPASNDLTGDGKITIADALKALRIAVGMEKTPT